MATSRDAISAAGKGDGIFFASDQQVSQVRLSEMGTFYVWNAAKKRRFLKKSWHTTYKDFNHLFYKAPNLTAGLQGVLYGREVFLSSGSNISPLQLGVYRAGFSASFPCYFSYLPTHPGFQNPAHWQKLQIHIKFAKIFRRK